MKSTCLQNLFTNKMITKPTHRNITTVFLNFRKTFIKLAYFLRTSGEAFISKQDVTD